MPLGFHMLTNTKIMLYSFLLQFYIAYFIFLSLQVTTLNKFISGNSYAKFSFQLFNPERPGSSTSLLDWLSFYHGVGIGFKHNNTFTSQPKSISSFNLQFYSYFYLFADCSANKAMFLLKMETPSFD